MFFRRLNALQRPFGAVSALLIVVACSNDSDPLDSVSASGQATAATAGPSTQGGPTSTPSSQGDPSTDPTGAGTTTESATESTTGTSETDDPTSGGPDTGGVSQESCERYVNCIAATDPAALPAAQMGFGPDAACWQGSPETAAQCLMACQTGLESAHMLYPDEPACFLCDEDADCGGEEQCQAGTCKFVGCGDGIVSDDEVCDGPSCPDCHAPGLCNPLSHAGCEAGEECLRIENEFKCANLPNLPGHHEDCPLGITCAAGLVCTIFDPVCGECCNSLCRTDGTANCDCNPFDPPYEYIGVCSDD